MKLSISEILKKASEMKDYSSRINWLRSNNSITLESVLRGAFDPTIVWKLPAGSPPYKPNDLVDQHHRLYSETRRFYLFVEGGNPGLNQLRRESLFIELLESIDPEDAKLMIAIKDKIMPYNNITIQLVNDSFPGIIKEVITP